AASPVVDCTGIEPILVEDLGASGDVGALGIALQSMQQDDKFLGWYCGCTPVQIQKITVRKGKPLPFLDHPVHRPDDPRIDSGQMTVSKKQWRGIVGRDQWHLKGIFNRSILWENLQ